MVVRGVDRVTSRQRVLERPPSTVDAGDPSSVLQAAVFLFRPLIFWYRVSLESREHGNSRSLPVADSTYAIDSHARRHSPVCRAQIRLRSTSLNVRAILGRGGAGRFRVWRGRNRKIIAMAALHSHPRDRSSRHRFHPLPQLRTLHGDSHYERFPAGSVLIESRS